MLVQPDHICNNVLWRIHCRAAESKCSLRCGNSRINWFPFLVDRLRLAKQERIENYATDFIPK